MWGRSFPGGPDWSAKPLQKQALHVEDGPRVDQQLPAVRLGDGAALVAEEDGGRPVQRVIKLLAEGQAAGRLTVQPATSAGSTPGRIVKTSSRINSAHV